MLLYFIIVCYEVLLFHWSYSFICSYHLFHLIYFIYLGIDVIALLLQSYWICTDVIVQYFILYGTGVGQLISNAQML